MLLPSTDNPASVSDIVRVGKAIKATYVVTPVFDFHSRSIWVDLGPRTVSTAKRTWRRPIRGNRGRLSKLAGPVGLLMLGTQL